MAICLVCSHLWGVFEHSIKYCSRRRAAGEQWLPWTHPTAHWNPGTPRTLQRTHSLTSPCTALKLKTTRAKFLPKASRHWDHLIWERESGSERKRERIQCQARSTIYRWSLCREAFGKFSSDDRVNDLLTVCAVIHHDWSVSNDDVCALSCIVS